MNSNRITQWLKLKRLGREVLSLKPGKVATEKLRLSRGAEETLLWKSDAVPLFSLVKSRTGKRTVELLGSGLTGAHTLFEDPEEAAPKPAP